MTRRSPIGAGLALVSILTLCAGLARGQDLRPDPRRILIRGPVVIEISRAFHGAIRKLETPSCQRLFSDFVDEEGRPLRDRLGEVTPAEYLAALVIRDGEIPKGSGRCASPGSAAFTVDGAAVFVCGRNFENEKPSRRETALIHEMLHTLGVRENPPSSAEITRAVEDRCGR